MYKERLLELGIPANLLGFEYLNLALKKYVPRQSICALYKDIAYHYSTTAHKVERSIANAISKIDTPSTNGNFIIKYKLLWKEENSCPTTSCTPIACSAKPATPEQPLEV